MCIKVSWIKLTVYIINTNPEVLAVGVQMLKTSTLAFFHFAIAATVAVGELVSGKYLCNVGFRGQAGSKKGKIRLSEFSQVDCR